MNKTPSDLLLYKLIPFINGNMRETKEDRINKWMLDYVEWTDENKNICIKDLPFYSAEIAKSVINDSPIKNDRFFWFAVLGAKKMIPYDIWRELHDCSNLAATRSYQVVYSNRKRIQLGKGQLTIEESYQHSNKRKREK